MEVSPIPSIYCKGSSVYSRMLRTTASVYSQIRLESRPSGAISEDTYDPRVRLAEYRIVLSSKVPALVCRAFPGTDV